MISQQLTQNPSLPITMFPHFPPLYNDPVVELIGEDIREVESRVSEMLRNRIFPAPDPLSWEFPTDLVYTYYNPRY